jgi:hypothetical protein
MIEGAGNHRSQIVRRCDSPQAMAEIRERAPPEQFVAAHSSRKFHKSLQEND